MAIQLVLAIDFDVGHDHGQHLYYEHRFPLSSRT